MPRRSGFRKGGAFGNAFYVSAPRFPLNLFRYPATPCAPQIYRSLFQLLISAPGHHHFRPKGLLTIDNYRTNIFLVVRSPVARGCLFWACRVWARVRLTIQPNEETRLSPASDRVRAVSRLCDCRAIDSAQQVRNTPRRTTQSLGGQCKWLAQPPTTLALPSHEAPPGRFFPALEPFKIGAGRKKSHRGPSQSVSVRIHPDSLFSITCGWF